MYNLIIKSQKEDVENKRKEKYNLTASLENLRPYSNNALIELIDYIEDYYENTNI